MGQSPSGPETSGTLASEDRLDSWKEIAAYLRRDVTTVQRWEKRERMPVRRHLHGKLGSVYAFRSELDAWSRSRNPHADDAPDLQGALAEANRRSSFVEARISAARTRRRSALRWGLRAVALLVAAVAAWLIRDRTEYFWRDPLENAIFQNVTDFGGTAEAAAVSRDGKLVAFESDRDGQMDVWLTQVGTGQFHNLTRGRVASLVNPQVRTLGFSPDGALVTFWARGAGQSSSRDINIWAIPTLGGEPQLYLPGAAEFEWAADGSRVVYHTPGPGDPTFIRQPGDRTAGRQIFSATAGRHAHFQTWSPDDGFIYFVQGTVPDMLDIWRVRPTGAEAERITQHNAQVSHPVLLNARTLMYLATESDGSGPWLHTLDVERRVPHRIGIGLDRYTSLSASADGRRVVATIANAKGTLWRIPLGDAPIDASVATPISLTTGRGFSPRLGPGYLLYVASKGRSDTIWKLVDGAAAMELWSAPHARIVGGPEVSPDGRQAAFSIEQQGRTLLYVMNIDGTNPHVVNESHEWRGAPAWSPDGGWLTSAATVNGAPHLFRVSVAGAVTGMLDEYATDPVWSPRGDFLVYSGADVGTRFPVKAVTASAAPHAIPAITLTRGARRLRFLSGRDVLVMLTGDLRHKDLSAIDLDTGTVRQLTKLPPDFTVRDFDISPDGREAVLERVQEQSEVVLIDLAR